VRDEGAWNAGLALHQSLEREALAERSYNGSSFELV
jgi:hypothetical protein